MSLTPRQKEIVKALGRGLSYKEVGSELGISAGTVRNYVHRMAERAPNPYRLTPKALVVMLARQSEERKAS